MNLCLLTDSYKLTHWPQYPRDTQGISSYFESRIGARWRKTCFFGLQYFLKKYIAGKVVTREKVEEAREISRLHLGSDDLFNYNGWMGIVNDFDGRLPLKIKAVPEGTCVPVSNVMMTVTNTHPDYYWLTNYLETLLVNVWYPCTVATQSREMKKVWLNYLNETGDPEGVDYKLHDFGCRGVTCPEQAGLGGAAHLVNFRGTDTLPALVLARQYYNEEMAGNSIPASEHSTMTSWGKDHEIEAMQNMLRSYPESAMIACVSDSFDIWNACENIWGKVLHDEIVRRSGTLVVRPDSGDPPTTVKKVIEILMDKFGYSINDKGYRVLNPKVRVIQGDGIDFDSMPRILETLKESGISADNLAMGSGGGLLQKLNRDTQKFAFKCSAIQRNGRWHDVWKDPITDPGKQSKRGRLQLSWHQGSHGKWLKTTPLSGADDEDVLQTVFCNGLISNETTLSEVRERAKIHEWELVGF